MGELYRDGLGVKRNTEEAVRWYRLAADRGDPAGAFALAKAMAGLPWRYPVIGPRQVEGV